MKRNMMTHYFEANLAVIKAGYPGLAEQLTQPVSSPGPAPFCEEDMVISGIDVPALTVKGLHLHSPRDPVREAQRLVQSLLPSKELDAGPLIVFGFGLGYGAEALAKKAPRAVLIIVEAHIELFRKALELRDLRDFLQNSKLIFILGGTGSGLVSAYTYALGTQQTSGPPCIYKNRALVSLDEAWYGALEAGLRIRASKDAVNAATLRRFGKRWVKNLSRNKAAIRDFSGVMPLKNVLGTQYPVLLVAAGPSLDAIAPILLKELYERCLVLACDTSLRFLLKAGIEPDFVVACDPQFWNVRHLDRAFAPHSCLITESSVYPATLRHPFERVLLCSSQFPLGAFIEGRVGHKGKLGSGGSVATTAWDFARFLGASCIWIAGLDLSFPALKTHFKGAVFEEAAHAASFRLKPAETFSVHALRDGVPFKTADASGGTVLTDKRLSLYAAWFEEQLRRYPQLQSRRLFPEGIAIRGLEAGNYEEVLARAPTRHLFAARLQAVFHELDSEFNKAAGKQERLERFEASLQDLREGLAHIITVCEHGSSLVQKGLASANRKPLKPSAREALLNEINGLNLAISQSTVKDTVSFLFPNPAELEATLTTPESRKFERYLESSALFFKTLAKTARFHLEELTS
ncbi:motility associated factor glycosyltransferase family protein [Breznakiellaceae bacterium SP9]